MNTFTLKKEEFLKGRDFKLLLMAVKAARNFRTPIDVIGFYRDVKVKNKKEENHRQNIIKLLSNTLEKIPMGHEEIGEWLYVVSYFVR